MLFGNQPFIADATATPVSEPSPIALGMSKRFSARADRIADAFHSKTTLKVSKPQAGMFALVDVSALGLDGETFAFDLLETHKVCVLPGSSFGDTLGDWIRVSLTELDAQFDEGYCRMIAYANALASA